jgi:hypothetical protein
MAKLVPVERRRGGTRKSRWLDRHVCQIISFYITHGTCSFIHSCCGDRYSSPSSPTPEPVSRAISRYAHRAAEMSPAEQLVDSRDVLNVKPCDPRSK